MAYEFLRWEPSDDTTAARLVELLGAVFGDDALDLEWFLWKHRDNPWGPSIVTYAVDSATGELAAVRVFWRWRLALSGRDLVAYQPCDTATLPEHQRRGLFTALTDRAVQEARCRGTDVLFNFPNANSAPGDLKMGWSRIGDLLVLAKAVRPFRATIAAARGWRSGGRAFLPDQRARGGGALTTATDWGAVADSWPAYEHLIAAVTDRGGLAWRFGSHPLTDYLVYADGGSRAVVRLGGRLGMREASIEAFAGPWSRHEARGILRRIAEATGAHIVSATLTPWHPAAEALRRIGFVRAPSRRQLMVRSLSDEARRTVSEAKWALTGHDLDTH